MTTFIAAPTVGVGSNNPTFGPVGPAFNFEGVTAPYTSGIWIAPFATINNNTQRPTIGQIFPLGQYYGGIPSFMSVLEGSTVTFIGTSTITVPSTTTYVKITLIAAGGNGAACSTSGQASGGGGGGGKVVGIYPVVPASTLTITLSTTGVCSVTGMSSGTPLAYPGSVGTTTAGGSGGTATGGTNYPGQKGGGPYGIGSAAGSGVGGSCSGAGVGGSFVINAAGNDGQFPGGGGSGGSGINVGGNGGNPIAILEWIQ